MMAPSGNPARDDGERSSISHAGFDHVVVASTISRMLCGGTLSPFHGDPGRAVHRGVRTAAGTPPALGDSS